MWWHAKRLRGEAAFRRRRSGNFRNPRGWVRAGSLTGDLGLSSRGSARDMTSPGQALIGRRGQQVPPYRESPIGTVRPRRRPRARGEVEKVGSGVLTRARRT
ncbi:unnamed protein product [Rangifer tarandus platyrhynchus]|uniref:Uncharacterized protein n=1 Tax=Rangifer tarandus platyrhynchus TaxID=3082113 RepID=A0AC59ZRR7_RANTA